MIRNGRDAEILVRRRYDILHVIVDNAYIHDKLSKINLQYVVRKIIVRCCISQLIRQSCLLKTFLRTCISMPTLSASISDFNTYCNSYKINFMARWWLWNPILWMKYVVWKRKKKILPNSSKRDENIRQVNNGLKIKTKLLKNENKFSKEERSHYGKSLDTILDHNTSLLKFNETLHQHP